MTPVVIEHPQAADTHDMRYVRDSYDTYDSNDDSFDDTFYPEDDGEPMAESDFQRESLVYAVDALDIFYEDDPNVYVSGNLLIYYEKGNPRAVFSPDAFVVQGVEKYLRKTYKLWIEKKPPSFIIEITSDSTRDRDEIEKPMLYQQVGVIEYFQFDPTGDYLHPALKGQRLNQHGEYRRIVPHFLPDGTLCLTSQVTGLELHLIGDKMRLFNPKTQEYLRSHKEEFKVRKLAEEHAAQEAEKRRKAEERAQQAEDERKKEAEERKRAEERMKWLEAELARLQGSNTVHTNE